MIRDQVISLFRKQEFLLCDGCTVGQFGDSACGAFVVMDLFATFFPLSRFSESRINLNLTKQPFDPITL